MAQDYQRAAFYFDAALIEDKEKSTKWEKLPAALFLTLNTRREKQFALELTRRTNDLTKMALRKFRDESHLDFDLKDLKEALSYTFAFRRLQVAVCCYGAS